MKIVVEVNYLGGGRGGEGREGWVEVEMLLPFQGKLLKLALDQLFCFCICPWSLSLVCFVDVEEPMELLKETCANGP